MKVISIVTVMALSGSSLSAIPQFERRDPQMWVKSKSSSWGPLTGSKTTRTSQIANGVGSGITDSIKSNTRGTSRGRIPAQQQPAQQVPNNPFGWFNAGTEVGKQPQQPSQQQPSWSNQPTSQPGWNGQVQPQVKPQQQQAKSKGWGRNADKAPAAKAPAAKAPAASKNSNGKTNGLGSRGKPAQQPKAKPNSAPQSQFNGLGPGGLPIQPGVPSPPPSNAQNDPPPGSPPRIVPWMANF